MMIKKLCVKCKVNLKNKLQIGNCQNVVFCTKLLSVVYHLVQNLHPLRNPFWQPSLGHLTFGIFGSPEIPIGAPDQNR